MGLVRGTSTRGRLGNELLLERKKNPNHIEENKKSYYIYIYIKLSRPLRDNLVIQFYERIEIHFGFLCSKFAD